MSVYCWWQCKFFSTTVENIVKFTLNIKNRASCLFPFTCTSLKAESGPKSTPIQFVMFLSLGLN